MHGSAAHPDADDRSATILSFEPLAVYFALDHFRRAPFLHFEDCFQSAMLAVTIAVDRFDPSRSVTLPQFVAICIRFQLGRDLAQAARHRKVLGSHVLEAADPADPSANPGDDDGYDRLYDAVNTLPVDDQAVIVKLFGLDGTPPVSRGQLARRTGRSKPAVCRSAARSLSLLRNSLTG